MHSVRVHKLPALLISVFYRIGFWHRGDKPTARELRIKLFYSIYVLLFVVSLVVGAISNESVDKSIFLAEASIGSAVVTIKFWIFIWKQNEILDLLNRVSVFSIKNEDDHNNFDDKLGAYTKFFVSYAITLIVAGSILSALPFVGSEKSLFLEIGFPFDWKTNEIAFWIAAFFTFTGASFIIITAIFSIVIWYLLLVCSLRYEVLGSEIKKMGRVSGEMKGKMTEQQMHIKFFEDLKNSIDSHIHLKKLTDEVGSYFSNIFFIQFGTSGLCICGSIYCLVFDIGHNLLEQIILLLIFLYLIAELFTITYFGNEIMLSSDRLSYSLFESDWIEQPQSTIKCIITFGEYLKQPQEIMVAKLYPLNLDTFTRILKSAYSMFNILKSFQQ